MKRTLAMITCCLLFASQPASAAEFRFSARPNKAHLIQWRVWGPGAFDEARKKDKLILLSLSAVWCHWCHVMDETTYSDAAVIAYINDHFIPVKVDADLRPDIDALYNQGGWPSTAILTPEGEVISGGNYFPADEMLGRLKRAAALFSSDGGVIADRLAQLRAMKESGERNKGGFIIAPDAEELDSIAGMLRASFDEKYGGFGGGQKFPNPDAIDFLLSRYVKKKDTGIKRVILTTLDHMAKGGIHDKVEGGFFRYATKSDWSGPHYEKMLEVNAGMIRNYAHAAMVFGRKDYLMVVRKSVRYVRNALFDAASGAFFGSQDADEKYYAGGDRTGRTAPAVDRTVYGDFSSLMISALLAAYEATGEKQYLDMAEKGSSFVQKNLFSSPDGVCHAYQDNAPSLKGLLLDNALYGAALLDLYSVTGEKRYLDSADELGRLMGRRFYDPATKRFRNVLASPINRPVTAGMLAETNENLANYRAITFLGRLILIGDFPKLTEMRDAAATTLAGEYKKFTPHAGAYGNALLWMVGEPIQITIIAEGDGYTKYLRAVNGVYVPEKVVRVLLMDRDEEVIRKLGYAADEAAYLCEGKRCSKPITRTDDLKKTLKEFMTKSNL